MTAVASPNPNYRPELDCLRFVAFLAVFVTHALPQGEATYLAHGFPTSVAMLAAAVERAGSFGVDLFFLLSAYLITSLLLQERATTGAIHVRAFYLRRILRIWPLYFFALGIAAVWGHFQPTFSMPANYLVAYLLLAGNWMTVLYGPPSSFMSILWSVSIEEQFYLTWPLFLRWLTGRDLRAAPWVLIGAAWAVRLYLASRPLHDSTVWPNTLARLDVIGWGIGLAQWRLPASLKTLPRPLLFLAGVGLWLVAGHFFAPTPAFTVAGYPTMTLGSMLIFLSFLGADLTFPWWTYLGKISYGLYVYHLLALTVIRLWLGGQLGHPAYFALYFISALAMTVALSAASYQWLEKPFLRLKNRFTLVASRPV